MLFCHKKSRLHFTMTSSFFFFDYETFGINPAFDRPSQFAGIRTDLEFNAIAEPINLYCKPQFAYLPAPEAVLITGITPQICQQKGLIERDFAKKIHQELSEPNTCSLGYNSIRFDEEFNRFLFYRNFYDPYEYSYKNGNSRWDLIDLTRACYALRPEGIEWPKDQNGAPSFKLEALSQANQLNHENAHDALSDVYATIELAKLIKSKQPRLFNYFYELRTKNKVKELIDKTGFTPLVHVSAKLGAYRSNLTLVVILTTLPHQQNAVIAVDLMGDIQSLIELSCEQIRQKLYTKSADLAENESRIPVKLIHINKAPILAPLNTLRPQDIERLNLNVEACLTKLEHIKTHFAEITSKLLDVFDPNLAQTDEVLALRQEAIKKDVFAENQLYTTFLSYQDKQLGERIRKTPLDALEFLTLETEDPRIAPLFLLYKIQNCPHYLSLEEQQKWQSIIQQKLTQEVISDYVQHLQALMIQYESDSEKLKLLQQLWRYCQELFN